MREKEPLKDAVRVCCHVLLALLAGNPLLSGCRANPPPPPPEADVIIWLRDTADKYYEPEAGDTVACTWGLRNALAALGKDVAVVTRLPSELGSYEAVFVSTGWYRC